MRSNIYLGLEDKHAQETKDYRKRHGIKAARILTVASEEDGKWMMERLAPVIAGKTVVEIGAGSGVLALMMARVAKHVFAIEADPQFTKLFLAHAASMKPTNLTWVFDAAQSLAPWLKADVAVVVTGSDEDGLRLLASQFAPVVMMPWQDWNDGRAVVSPSFPFSSTPAPR